MNIKLSSMKTRAGKAGAIADDRYAFENPEIAEDENQRINNALNFVKDRNWNIAKAAKKAGIDRFKLKRYVIIYSIFCI